MEAIPVHIYVDSSGGKVREVGKIVRPICEDVLVQHQDQWVQHLADQEDCSWQWRSWVEEDDDLRDGNGCRHYALLRGETACGLMIARDTSKAPFQAPENDLEDGVYVEYLAAAPWNRTVKDGVRICETQPRVAPVGKLLMWKAIMLSKHVGHEGRVSWHSKKDAVDTYMGWFKKSSPTDIHTMDGEDWPYFEISPAEALAFVSEIAPLVNLG